MCFLIWWLISGKKLKKKMQNFSSISLNYACKATEIQGRDLVAMKLIKSGGFQMDSRSFITVHDLF